ncbi:MAG: CPBP family glutamic-type intramembrane protease [Planctomycetota bacterium]
MHIEPGNFAVVPPLIAMGLFLAHLRERTGGLLAPIAMHTVYNSVQMVGVLLVADQAI